MYANELLIERRVKLSEDVDVYYNIEGIHTPLFVAQKGSDGKSNLKDVIKKLLHDNHAA